MIQDLTEGKPFPVLLRFALPMMVSVVFQQLYNAVDSIVAGQFAGTDALAAVGASYPVTTLLLSVAAGLNVGASVIVSQLFGRKRMDRMKSAVYTSLWLALWFSLAVTAAGLMLRHPLMRLLRTPESVYALSDVYLRIYVYGILFLFAYNICNGVFTALGDSRTPLLFLIFSSLLNVALDLLLTAVLRWGVAGVAWATFIAQGTAAVLSFLTLLRRMRAIRAEAFKTYDGAIARQILRISVPSMFQQASISIGNMVIQGLVNGYGSAVIAGYAAGAKIITFGSITITTLGNAYGSFVAQNVGARRPDRIKEGYLDSLILLYLGGLFFFAAGQLFPQALVHLFIKKDQIDAVAAGVLHVRLVSIGYLVLPVKLAADGILKGAGDVTEFMIATFSDLISRCTTAAILSSIFHDPAVIWLSWSVGWAMGSVLATVFVKRGRWKRSLEPA